LNASWAALKYGSLPRVWDDAGMLNRATTVNKTARPSIDFPSQRNDHSNGHGAGIEVN
jgi:hypothetical protein